MRLIMRDLGTAHILDQSALTPWIGETVGGTFPRAAHCLIDNGEAIAGSRRYRAAAAIDM